MRSLAEVSNEGLREHDSRLFPQVDDQQFRSVVFWFVDLADTVVVGDRRSVGLG